MAAAARQATRRSLVLIDELGRSTSSEDGLAIAWGCSEYLLALGARTVLATHERRLTGLAALYPAARPCFLEVERAQEGGCLEFTFCLSEGRDAVANYGLAVAQAAGLMPSVLARARAVAAELERRDELTRAAAVLSAAAAGTGLAGGSAAPAASAAALAQTYSLAQRLLCLRYAHVGMGEAELREYLLPLTAAARALLPPAAT